MEEKNTARGEFWKGFLLGIAVMLAAGTGAVLALQNVGGGGGTAMQAVSAGETQKKLKGIAGIIDTHFYKDVEQEQLQEGIYSGLMDSLGDSYAAYYNEEDYKKLEETMGGSYCGIGIVVSQNQKTMETVITGVYPDSPAAEAGLREGDIILAVDGTATDKEELAELKKRIMGEEGTQVRITVQRAEEPADMEFTVSRRNVEIPSVEGQLLSGTIGYLKIIEFSELTADAFRDGVERLRESGMTALIVDVRDNPGGMLNVVCDILDQLLPEGIVVYTEDKDGNRRDYRSDGATALDMPLAVLINENSASASEIFAGAVKDYKYGTLIGTKTFGKGIVQSVISLKDGTAVKLTTAKYFTPKGNDIHEVGIEPDINLNYRYLGPENKEYQLQYDNQVVKAMEVLMGN